MFPSQLTLGLIGVIILLSGVGVLYYKMSEAEKAVLIANNAQLEIAVKTNENTIKQLRDNAEKIAEANINLSIQLAEAERISSIDNMKILQEDLIQSSIDDPSELERKINEDYFKNNRILESITTFGVDSK